MKNCLPVYRFTILLFTSLTGDRLRVPFEGDRLMVTVLRVYRLREVEKF